MSLLFLFFYRVLCNTNFHLFKVLLSIFLSPLFIPFSSSFLPFPVPLLFFLFYKFCSTCSCPSLLMPPSFCPLTSPFFSLPFQPVIFPVPFPMATLPPIYPLVPLPGRREHTRTPFSLWPKEERIAVRDSMVTCIYVVLSDVQFDK